MQSLWNGKFNDSLDSQFYDIFFQFFNNFYVMKHFDYLLTDLILGFCLILIMISSKQQIEQSTIVLIQASTIV